MSRLALSNIIGGFVVIIFAAFYGVFNAFQMTVGFMRDPTILGSWETTLSQSAHGHSNMFGILLVLFGLTMSYSCYSRPIKLLQSMGLWLGVVGMGPLVWLRGQSGVSESTDMLGICIGLCMSLALLSLIIHVLGMSLKIMRH